VKDALFLRVFPSVALPIFLAVSDQTLVATALPLIAGDLGHVQFVSWVVIAYLIASTLAAPIYGCLGDVIGRRRMLMVALIIFVVGALTCAAAPRFDILIAARALQGLGAGGLMTLSHALIGDSVPLRERGRYQGYLGSVMVCATTFGPLAGGVVSGLLGWRAVFLSTPPFALIALALATRLPGTQSASKFMRQFDFIGVILFALTLVPLMTGMQFVPIPGREGTKLAFLLLGISAVAFVALIRHERRFPTPLFSGALLSQPTIWRCALVAGFYGAAFVSLVTFTPIYLRAVRGFSSSEIGVLLFTLTAGAGVGSFLCGRLVTRTGRTMLFPSLALTFAAVGLVFLATTFAAVDRVPLQALYGILALCFGSVMGVLQVTVQHAAGSEGRGAASSIVQFSRSLGAASGTLIVSTALFLGLANADATILSNFRLLLEQGPAALSPLALESRREIIAVLLTGFRDAFAVIALLTSLASVAAWTTPLRRIYQADQTK
jgi:MFS family permease